jgi:hypothetical protein
MHMAKKKAKIATRVSFRVRRDGLYRLINRGRWRRVARRSKTLQLRFRQKQILVDDGTVSVGQANGSRVGSRNRHRENTNSADQRIKRGDGDAISQAVDQVLEKSIGLDGIVEVLRDRRSVRAAGDLDQATGFLIKVPGIGPTLVVRPAALRNWVHGAVPFRRVLAGLDAKGHLIRGADGKTTRQVVVPGLGRGRYYCFKTTGPRVAARPRFSRDPSRQPPKLGPGPAAVPTPSPEPDFDDDWGPVAIAAPADQVTGHRHPMTAKGPTSPAARGGEGRELGTVATWRGLRPIRGDCG